MTPTDDEIRKLIADEKAGYPLRRDLARPLAEEVLRLRAEVADLRASDGPIEQARASESSMSLERDQAEHRLKLAHEDLERVAKQRDEAAAENAKLRALLVEAKDAIGHGECCNAQIGDATDCNCGVTDLQRRINEATT